MMQKAILSGHSPSITDGFLRCVGESESLGEHLVDLAAFALAEGVDADEVGFWL